MLLIFVYIMEILSKSSRTGWMARVIFLSRIIQRWQQRQNIAHQESNHLSSHYQTIPSMPIIFQLLGLLSNMKGITTERIASACVLKLYNGGQIQMLNKSEPQQFSQYTAHFIADNNVNQQTQSCNYVTFLPMGEQAPLQRAEWIKYLGVFVNMEVRANQIYDAVRNNYMCLVQSAANKTKKFKPIVAWMEFFDGVWSFTVEEYKLKYIEDAGGENIDESINKVTYNISIGDDLEQLQAILCTIDVVIDGTLTADPLSYNASTFLQNLNVEDQSCFSFLSSQSLWRYDKRVSTDMALDWFDGAVSQPQLVLADLVEVFFPSGNYTTTYFRNLVKEEPAISIGPENCDRDSSIAMEPTIVICP
ncbi:uncharacterized protein LOC111916038 isoform X3 [Lactuca sativa]|uniref:Uncharacterized protein n=1 Tax=Lactuca sativa TaxID=4236 RepID=A0A9R1WFG3_LACSA|nr:uncharacterized protein LOC111916038 isoform X3 [Lactuca sativa]KAJ0222858.1 hypothetical protein LSAT_V11C200076060 [Lactuca sativa]